jgi:hypothetical protein
MKVKDVKAALDLFNPDLEVRVMDVTREELGDETYTPTFPFTIDEMDNDSPDSEEERFIAIQFNPEDAKEDYQILVDAVQRMGWSIAVTEDHEAVDDQIRGLVVGLQDYVNDILNKLDKLQEI